ncbi:hypothetical protein GRF29_8g406306 [Pseudopithomyces chartarum]|uniref:Uncharacterized protein n=1 Tax=Pseudopithomyces chartarum TaxID=1892770 RepID=A0AAN6M600_9PLEO|nr:hypothetical protein GRF29_8g406306 [Pseudopithomyces chartarum]
MVFGALIDWFTRLGAHWTHKRVHKDAKKKEMRDRKVREERWNDLRQSRPTYFSCAQQTRGDLYPLVQN